jgi:RNA polymerase sigma factor (sigma-70 family)
MPASPTDEELLSAALAGDERAFGELYRRWQGPMFRFARQMCGADGGAEDVVQEVFVALIENGQQFDPTRGPLAAYLYGVARHQALRRLRTDGRYTALDEERAEADEGMTAGAEMDDGAIAGVASSGAIGVSASAGLVAGTGGGVIAGASSRTSSVASGLASAGASGGAGGNAEASGWADPGGWMPGAMGGPGSGSGAGGPGGGLSVGAALGVTMDDPGVMLDRRLSIDLVHRLVVTLPVPYREALVLCDLHELGYAEAAAALGCPVGTVRSRLHRARALLAEKVRSGVLRRGIA